MENIPERYNIYHDNQRIQSVHGRVGGIISHRGQDYILHGENMITVLRDGMVMASIQAIRPVDQMVKVEGSPCLILGRKGDQLYQLSEHSIDSLWRWEPYRCPVKGHLHSLATSHGGQHLAVLYTRGRQQHLATFHNVDGHLRAIESHQLEGNYTHAALGKDHRDVILFDQVNGVARVGLRGSLRPGVRPGSALNAHGAVQPVGKGGGGFFYTERGLFHVARKR